MGAGFALQGGFPQWLIVLQEDPAGEAFFLCARPWGDYCKLFGMSPMMLNFARRFLAHPASLERASAGRSSP